MGAGASSDKKRRSGALRRAGADLPRAAYNDELVAAAGRRRQQVVAAAQELAAARTGNRFNAQIFRQIDTKLLAATAAAAAPGEHETRPQQIGYAIDKEFPFGGDHAIYLPPQPPSSAAFCRAEWRAPIGVASARPAQRQLYEEVPPPTGEAQWLRRERRRARLPLRAANAAHGAPAYQASLSQKVGEAKRRRRQQRRPGARAALPPPPPLDCSCSAASSGAELAAGDGNLAPSASPAEDAENGGAGGPSARITRSQHGRRRHRRRCTPSSARQAQPPVSHLTSDFCSDDADDYSADSGELLSLNSDLAAREEAAERRRRAPPHPTQLGLQTPPPPPPCQFQQDQHLYYSATTTTTTRTRTTAEMASRVQANGHKTSASEQSPTLKMCSPNSAECLPCHKLADSERGLAFDDEERTKLGLRGLLPPAVQDQQLQARAVCNFIDNCKDELGKYVYLRHLKDFNEKLFYFTLTQNVEKLMPFVYTPTVGLGCEKFSEIYMRPRGLFVSIKDLGSVRQVLANWPERDVRVIVVTDGERILGLGDLGANGMGISIGKLSLYTALAGIPPKNVLPVTIDVGTNNERFLKDPFYIGLRQKRVRGERYEKLIEEFMEACAERFGSSCLIQFEDFANATAFNLLTKYRNNYCTFNDDIQGTAAVALSGLLTSAQLIGKRLADCSFLFYGAGEANLGTAHLLVMAMVDEAGLTKREALDKIWLVDSKGLVVSSRTDLSEHKLEFAREAEHIKDLEAIIDSKRPSAIIGASAQANAFNEQICSKMAKYNERPIIFALSNPTSKAECTADQAYRWTNGKCVFASGSPFAPVEFNGKTFITGQGNNAYIFPGIGLAAIGAHAHVIPEEAFLVAARALSAEVTQSDLSVGLVYPRLAKIRDVTLKVATRVLEFFYAERLAAYRPEPSDKLDFLRQLQYDPHY